MATDLNDVAVFTRVAQERSFTGAARALGLPKSTVSERVARLEQRLGVRLLERTTRSLRLTETGAAYFARVLPVVDALADAEREVAAAHRAPRGLLRIGSPLLFAQAYLADVVAEYLDRYPEVHIELVVADRAFDVVEEHLDLAIHVMGPIEPTAFARKLGMGARVCVASAAYVARRGKPVAPRDLADHACLVAGTSRKATWTFTRGDEVATVPVAARYAVSAIELVHRACVQGLGIAVVPAFLCADGLAGGTLVPVLSDWSAGETLVQVVYPSNRHMSARARAFADLLADRASALRVGAADMSARDRRDF